MRTEIELSLFGDVSNYRDFFKVNAGQLKSIARLFDLSAALPASEVRQLVNEEMEKIIMSQKRIHKSIKQKRMRTQLVRSWAGRLKKRIFK